MSKSSDQRVWFLNAWVTIIHHWLILPQIFYTLYYSCSNASGMPWPTEEGGTFTKLNSEKRWGFLKDQVCFLEVNKGFVFIELFSIAYMINDFVKLYFHLESQNKYIRESIFHHSAIFIAFFCSFIGGYAYPGICNMFLIAEVSSIFLNYNDMFSKKNRGSTLAFVNKMCFFVAYTITRVISWPYFQYLIIWNFFYIWSEIGFFRKISIVVGWIQSMAVLVLNFYWYYLILKKLVRMI